MKKNIISEIRNALYGIKSRFGIAEKIRDSFKIKRGRGTHNKTKKSLSCGAISIINIL